MELNKNQKRQKRKAQDRLEMLLLEGLQSGEPIEVTDEYVARRRAELLAKFGNTCLPRRV
jgi:antitoxin ParD1/3/4